MKIRNQVSNYRRNIIDHVLDQNIHKKKQGLVFGSLTPPSKFCLFIYYILKYIPIINVKSICLRKVCILYYISNWFYSSQQFASYLFALIFPTCRWITNGPTGNIQFLYIFTSLFCAVDILPRSSDHCHINPYTCLILFFFDAIIYSLSDLHAAFITLLCHINCFKTSQCQTSFNFPNVNYRAP